RRSVSHQPVAISFPGRPTMEDVAMSSNHPDSSGRRTNRLPWSLFAEAVVCRLDGTKVRPTVYRRGRTRAGAASSFQFRPSDFDTDCRCASHEDPTIRETILERLTALLLPEEIDLLYLIHVAGKSAAALARESNVHRANSGRREKRLFAILRNDPILKQFDLG